MICPKCGAEYRPGFTQCSDCSVALVDKSKYDKWHSSSRPADLVTVFTGGDPGRIALAKSLLESAGIRFVVLNEAMQELVGLGRFPFGQNLIVGPVEIQVNREDGTMAMDLLKDLGPYRERSGDAEDPDGDDG
jgi:hypothetical protein